MPIAQGVVASVNTNRRTFNTKHGPRWHLRFTLQDGRQFKYPFVNPEIPDEQLPIQQGQTVEFMFTESFHDGHQNLEVDKKTLQVTGGGPQMNQGYPQGPQGGYQNGGNNAGGYGGYQQQPPQQQQGYPQQGQQPYQQQHQAPPQQQYQQPSAPKKNSQNNSGMAIGAALNQAATLLGQGASLQELEDLAWQLLELADRMNDMVRNGQYKQVPAQAPQQGGQTNPNPQQPAPPQGANPSQGASYNGGQQPPQHQQYQQPQGPGQPAPEGAYDPGLPQGFQGGGGYTQDFSGR